MACAASNQPTDSGEDDPSLAEYTRLEVGTERTYGINFVGQSGELAVRVVREEDGWVIDDRGGQWKLDAEGLRDRQRYLIRRPLQVGTEWKSIVSASAVERYRIASVGEPCAVRAGQFSDCLVVESTLRRDARMTLTARWTWIRGVGLGRIETASVVDGRSQPQTRQDLVHYRLDSRSDPDPAAEESSGSPQTDWGR